MPPAPPPPPPPPSGPLPSEAEQRELLETVTTNLPPAKKTSSSSSSGLVTTRFVLGLLRTANTLRASEASRTAVERTIASKLEHITLDDLLMPSYSYLVDCVQQIVGFVLEGLEKRSATAAAAEDADDEEAGSSPCTDKNKLLVLGKLVDTETTSGANLKPDKFCDLALELPDHRRMLDDGLYHAVNVYLSNMRWIKEAVKNGQLKSKQVSLNDDALGNKKRLH